MSLITQDNIDTRKASVGSLRKYLQEHHQIRIPRVHIIDNIHLDPNGYIVYVAEERA